MATQEQLYGLIGYPLSHSFSKRYFTQKFQEENILNSRYELFPLAGIELFPKLLESQPNLCGLNVTIPYKQSVLPYLHELSPEAAGIGAVNTIHLQNGQLIGHNTDAYGFRASLQQLMPTVPPQLKALILGSGGAAKAVAYVLRQLDIPYLTVSRTPARGKITYAQLTEGHMKTHRLIINTTPLGMSPNTESAPSLPYQYLSPQHFLYDLVYNPEKTVFLRQGQQYDCTIKNGLDMLHLQAEKAWTIWQNKH